MYVQPLASCTLAHTTHTTTSIMYIQPLADVSTLVHAALSFLNGLDSIQGNQH
jgi:hypothetical protein